MHQEKRWHRRAPPKRVPLALTALPLAQANHFNNGLTLTNVNAGGFVSAQMLHKNVKMQRRNMKDREIRLTNHHSR